MRTIIAILLISVSCSANCGVERAKVKQLTDNPTLLPVRVSSIAEIAKYPLVKVGNNTPRSKIEKQVVTVKGTLIGYKLEADEDIHMVISDGKHTMIIESIDPSCPSLKGSKYLPKFQAVRDWIAKHLQKPTPKFRKCNIPITATGIIFEDKIHGQTGVARNGYEIHPLFGLV